MPARPVWKGSLKLSLINVPIRVFNAVTPAGEISFRQVHKSCGTPIQLKKWCPHHNREVESSELAKGYEVERGQFVLFDPSDIKAVRPPATYVVAISRVVDRHEIDLRYIEHPYYVLPDTPSGASAFAVIRQALTNTAAIGTVALHGREYIVALMPQDKGLLMLTLRRADEVVAISDLDAGTPRSEQVSAAELKLARQVLGGFAGRLDLSEYPDEYETALRKMIEDKVAGHKIVAAAIEKPAKVVNLMDALRQSLEQTGGARRRMQARRGRVLPHGPRRARAAHGTHRTRRVSA